VRQRRTGLYFPDEKSISICNAAGEIKSHERTERVTLPASTPLSKAGAVHHVALVVALGEVLVYFIGQGINHTLIWTREKSGVKSAYRINASRLIRQFCVTSKRSDLSDLAAVTEPHSSTPHGRCPGMCTPSRDPWHHGVCPTYRLRGASVHRWWYMTPHGLHKERWE